MVESQIRGRRVLDPLVLRTMAEVPRHEFLEGSSRTRAYEDRPLPIGDGQTISQPYMVAVMTELLHLTGKERVLELGTGSGYQTAVLAHLAGEVFTVERIGSLSMKARAVLDRLGLGNIRYHVGDGSQGWPEHGPYDRILIAAAAPEPPPSLLAQLADPGILVLPMGGHDLQDLVSVVRKDGKDERKVHFKCTFVPLIGEEGFPR